jgi:hypothetical protein
MTTGLRRSASTSGQRSADDGERQRSAGRHAQAHNPDATAYCRWQGPWPPLAPPPSAPACETSRGSRGSTRLPALWAPTLASRSSTCSTRGLSSLALWSYAKLRSYSCGWVHVIAIVEKQHRIRFILALSYTLIPSSCKVIV